MAKRLLLIDDDSAVRKCLSAFLEAEGYEVALAADGEEALLRLYAGERPGLILLDLRMPVLNGWEFRHLQQQDPELGAIPVVIMSGEDSTASLGAVHWLHKPINFAELRRVVERHCLAQDPGRQGKAPVAAHRRRTAEPQKIA